MPGAAVVLILLMYSLRARAVCSPWSAARCYLASLPRGLACCRLQKYLWPASLAILYMTTVEAWPSQRRLLLKKDSATAKCRRALPTPPRSLLSTFKVTLKVRFLAPPTQRDNSPARAGNMHISAQIPQQASSPQHAHNAQRRALCTRMAYTHHTNHHKSHCRAGGPAPRRNCLQQPQWWPGTTHGTHLPCHTHCPRPHGTTHARSTRRPHTIRSNTTRLGHTAAAAPHPLRHPRAYMRHACGVLRACVRAYVRACVRV